MAVFSMVEREHEPCDATNDLSICSIFSSRLSIADVSLSGGMIKILFVLDHGFSNSLMVSIHGGVKTLTSDLFCYLEDIEIYILCIKCPFSAKMESCQAQCPGLYQVMLLYLLLFIVVYPHQSGAGLLRAVFMGLYLYVFFSFHR